MNFKFRNLAFSLQNGNEYIAHLRDQLQEMKAKTNLENLYMKRNAELQISQTQKKCNRAEELLLEEIEVTCATLGCLGMELSDRFWSNFEYQETAEQARRGGECL